MICTAVEGTQVYIELTIEELKDLMSGEIKHQTCWTSEGSHPVFIKMHCPAVYDSPNAT